MQQLMAIDEENAAVGGLGLGCGSYLLELAGSECRMDRRCFYERIAPLFRALHLYRCLRVSSSQASPSLAVEMLDIGACLDEELLALLRGINSEAYELFLRFSMPVVASPVVI